MKRIIIVLCFYLICSSVYASQNFELHFGGQNYKLLYSEKAPEHSGYINEYFKSGENRNSWSEVINVIHFPNAYSPLDYAQEFSRYLNSINCPNALVLDEEQNTALLDFIIIDGQKLPIILEFNVFKYEKQPECGTVAIQYVKKYSVYSTEQVEKIKKEFKKLRPRTLKELKKTEIPNIVKHNVDEIKLNDLQ